MPVVSIKYTCMQVLAESLYTETTLLLLSANFFSEHITDQPQTTNFTLPWYFQV